MKRDQKLYARFGTDFIFPNRHSHQSPLSPTSILHSLLHQFSHINPLTSFPYAFWFGFCFFKLCGARYRLASSRNTELDTRLIRNLQVSSFVSYPPHKNLISWWSKSILGILSVGKSIRNQHLIRNLQVSSFVSHPPYKNLISWWSKSTLGIFPVGESIKNWFAWFHHCHAPLLWGIWSQIQAWYKIFNEESMQNEIHCHAPLLRGTWSQIQA